MGIEQDSQDENGNIWEVPDEAGDIKPLNSGELSLPVKTIIISSSKKINPALPEKNIMASPEITTTLLILFMFPHPQALSF